MLASWVLMGVVACDAADSKTTAPSADLEAVRSDLTFAQLKSYGDIIKTGYGIGQGILSYLGFIDSLDDKLNQVTEDILAAIKKAHSDDVVSESRALIAAFQEIARNPTNPTSILRYASWLDRSQSLISRLQTDLAGTDPEVLYALVLPFNTIGALRLTMLRGSVELGVPNFDEESIRAQMRILRQTNHDLLGAEVAFPSGDRSRWINTTRASKLWKFKFGPEAGQSCGPPPVLAFFHCSAVSNTCISEAGGFGRCTDSCDQDGCVDSCTDVFTHLQSGVFTDCFKGRLAQASALLAADSVVGVIREAQYAGYAALDEAVNDATFGSVVPARWVPYFKEDPIAAAYGSGGALNLFYRGSDLALHQATKSGQSWVHTNLGGVLLSGPAVASRVSAGSPFGAPATENWDVFGRGTDNGIYTRHRTVTLTGPFPGGAWSPWGFTGGTTVDKPVLTTGRPTRITVAAVDTQRAPQMNTLSLGWSGWHSWSSRLLQSAPVMVSWGDTRLDLFGVGLDGSLRHGAGSTIDNGTSESLGGVVGQPSATSWGTNRLDVVALGLGQDIFHLAWNGAGWEPFHPISNGVGTSTPAIVSWGVGRLDVFVRGTDNALYHTSCDGCAPDQWRNWEYLGGVLRGQPVVTTSGPNRLDIYLVGIDDAIYHKAWNDQGWVPSTTGFELVGGQVSR